MKISCIRVSTGKQVEFVSREEAIHTATPPGKFTLTVFAAVAELKRESILQRQREGIAFAEKQGKYLGRKPLPPPGLKPNTFYRRRLTKKSLAFQHDGPI